MNPSPIHFDSKRWQEVFLVLYALEDMGATRTKREVLNHIRTEGWYAYNVDDLDKYSGQNDYKYQTTLAWARKDAVIRELFIDPDGKDQWEISRKGRELLKLRISCFRERDITKTMLDVGQCYLWTKRFRTIIDPLYTPSPKDAKRPKKVNYLDIDY
jgi:hypothetical protein